MLTQEQKQGRKKGIGGSDAPAVAGISPWRQPLAVYLEKRGEIPSDDLDDVEHVRWGNLLEDTVAQEWAHRTGQKAHRVNSLLTHPDYPWMLGNIDRRVVGANAGLEIKTRGFFAASDYGPSGTDEVKEDDIIQCHHYMLVTGWRLWHMAVLIGGQELREYTIPFDQTLGDELIEVEADFWRNVQDGTPPPIIYEHRTTIELLKKMYPGSNGRKIILPGKAADLYREMKSLNKSIRASEKRSKAIKAELMDMQGEAAIGLLPDESGGFGRKEITRKGYTTKDVTYWDFRFSSKHSDSGDVDR